MKYVLEFGVRGGAHVDNLVFPTAKLAALTARSIAQVFTNDPCRTTFYTFLVLKGEVRRTWENKTHFVSVSRLDGVMRGAASAALWRKLPSDEFMQGDEVNTY